MFKRNFQSEIYKTHTIVIVRIKSVYMQIIGTEEVYVYILHNYMCNLYGMCINIVNSFFESRLHAHDCVIWLFCVIYILFVFVLM